MKRDSQRYDSVAQHLNRRRVLTGAGALALGGTGLTVVTETTRASVSVDGLDVPDAEFTAKEIDPEVRVTIGYEYDAGEEPVDALGFTLTVDGDIVAEDRLVTDRTTLENDTELVGSVTDSSEWDAEDFAPEVAESVTREVSVGVTFDVLDSRDESIVGDTATTTADVTVSHPQESTWTAAVGGTGEIVDAR